MLYKYEATTSQGEEKAGTIEAANRDIAIAALRLRARKKQDSFPGN